MMFRKSVVNFKVSCLTFLLLSLTFVASAQDLKKELKKDLKNADKAWKWLNVDLSTKYYQKVLNNPESKNLSPEILLRIYDNLAWSYLFMLERSEEAEPLFKLAIEIRQNNKSSKYFMSVESCFYLQNFFFLGYSQLNQKKYNEAEINFKLALSIWEKVGQGDSYMKHNIVNGIATVNYYLNKYEIAEPLLKEVVKFHLESEKGLSTHYQTSEIICTLANLYRSQGRFSEAEPLYLKAITIMEWYEKNASKGVPDFDAVTIRNLREYAVLLRKTNREAEAVKLEEKANKINNSNPINN